MDESKNTKDNRQRSSPLANASEEPTRRFYPEKPRPMLKWFTLTKEEQRRKTDEWWSEYFARYPEPGSSSEMNYLRAFYRR